MNLPPKAQWEVSDALCAVEQAAKALAAVRDTDAAKEALLAVRAKAVQAYGLITEAEHHTRAEALAKIGEVA